MPYFFEDEYALYGSDRVQSALQRWRPDAWTTFTSAADETFSQYLILIGFKICNSCRTSKTIFPV